MGEGKNLLGVDIGSSSIKICQLKQSRTGLALHRVGFAHLPPGAVADGKVHDTEVVTQALNSALKQSGIRQREAALSVSGQIVIIRKITIPLMSRAALAEHIDWEAANNIPFDLEEVHVDYQVLRRRPEVDKMDLLLVAAKRDDIDSYANLARRAKLKPLVFDIDAFTVQNLFELTHGLPPGQTVALINAGASTSTLNIISGGVSAFTREIASGGNVITEEIQKSLGISPEQANAYKCGGDPHGKPGMVPKVVGDIVSQVCDSIASEIQRSVDFFMATAGEGEIAHIMLTGGTANLPALAEAIQRRSRVAVRVWGPLQGVTVIPRSINPNLLQYHGAQMAVALGLALRREREVRE